MEESNVDFFKGQFLMAMPGLADPNFSQTVTCISEHTPEGAVGIVVNRIHSLLSGDDIFKELKLDHSPDAAAIPIHIGGPVNLGEIFILHGPPFGWRGSLEITPSLAMSNTMDILEAIAINKGPKAFIISIGCAGWGPGQLEAEIRENVWLTGPVYEDVIFENPISSRWEAAVRKLGIRPELLSDQAGHA
jgi:putative transcriptional regulator